MAWLPSVEVRFVARTVTDRWGLLSSPPPRPPSDQLTNPTGTGCFQPPGLSFLCRRVTEEWFWGDT